MSITRKEQTMLKIICDRCGKEIIYPNAHVGDRVIRMKVSDNYEYDLCKECRYKVINFITKGERTKGADDE